MTSEHMSETKTSQPDYLATYIAVMKEIDLLYSKCKATCSSDPEHQAILHMSQDAYWTLLSQEKAYRAGVKIEADNRRGEKENLVSKAPQVPITISKRFVQFEEGDCDSGAGFSVKKRPALLSIGTSIVYKGYPYFLGPTSDEPLSDGLPNRVMYLPRNNRVGFSPDTKGHASIDVPDSKESTDCIDEKMRFGRLPRGTVVILKNGTFLHDGSGGMMNTAIHIVSGKNSADRKAYIA
jgi:hypothetical protein